MEIRVVMREGDDGRWTASAAEDEPDLRASGSSRERCIASLRRAVERSVPAGKRSEPVTIVVETMPELAGVAEAADVMGWDKRRVVTYIDRGRFPEPVQS